MTKVLNIEKLYVSFDTYTGEVQAVRGVSYHVEEGEVLAVVGESGCGKSVTAQTIMKLNPMPPARIKSGKLTVPVLSCSRRTAWKIQHSHFHGYSRKDSLWESEGQSSYWVLAHQWNEPH